MSSSWFLQWHRISSRKSRAVWVFSGVPMHFTRIIFTFTLQFHFYECTFCTENWSNSNVKINVSTVVIWTRIEEKKSGHKMWLFRLRLLFSWFVALCGYEILRRSRSRSINKNKQTANSECVRVLNRVLKCLRTHTRSCDFFCFGVRFKIQF